MRMRGYHHIITYKDKSKMKTYLLGAARCCQRSCVAGVNSSACAQARMQDRGHHHHHHHHCRLRRRQCFLRSAAPHASKDLAVQEHDTFKKLNQLLKDKRRGYNFHSRLPTRSNTIQTPSCLFSIHTCTSNTPAVCVLTFLRMHSMPWRGRVQ